MNYRYYFTPNNSYSWYAEAYTRFRTNKSENPGFDPHNEDHIGLLDSVWVLKESSYQRLYFGFTGGVRVNNGGRIVPGVRVNLGWSPESLRRFSYTDFAEGKEYVSYGSPDP